MKEMQEMRAMLDKLNIATVTPAIASSPTSTVTWTKINASSFIQQSLESAVTLNYDSFFMCLWTNRLNQLEQLLLKSHFLVVFGLQWGNHRLLFLLMAATWRMGLGSRACLDPVLCPTDITVYAFHPPLNFSTPLQDRLRLLSVKNVANLLHRIRSCHLPWKFLI